MKRIKNIELALYVAMAVLFAIVNRGYHTFFLSYVTFGILSYVIFRNNISFNINLVFFLTPCIRILDVSETPYLINILILFIGMKYLIFERKQHSGRAMLIVMVLGCLEIIHLFAYADYFSDELLVTFNVLFDIYVCISILTDKNVKLSYEKMLDALAYGVMTSAFAYVAAQGLGMMQRIISWSLRFCAYGNDPNYYSIYIILALFGKVSMEKHKATDIFKIMILIALELLTASKMGFICLALYIAYILYKIFRHSENKKIYIEIMVCITGIMCLFHNIMTQLIQRVIERFSLGGRENSLNALTTGRLGIVENYLDAIVHSMKNLFFGYGLGYHKRFETYVYVAHNTYLDILLSWGIIGTVFTVAIIVNFYKKQCRGRNGSYAIIIAFGFMLMSLSCLTADMFWYLLVLIAYAAMGKVTEEKEE